MGLNCIYKTPQGEISKTYEGLKSYYRDHIDVKEPTTKNVVKTLDDQAYKISEHWYHHLFTDEFKEWFGNGRVNEQGEPELFIKEFDGRKFAYFENEYGIRRTIDGAKFNDMSLTLASELVDQLLYQILVTSDITFNNISDVKKIIFSDSAWDKLVKSIEKNVIIQEEGQPSEKLEARLGEVRRTLAKYKEDFINELQKKFEQFSIEFQMQENNVDEIEESEQIGNVVRKDRGKTNSKDSASANIKMLLSFSVPEVVEVNGKRQTVTGTLFGLPKFKKFGSVWNVLEPALANMPTIMNEEGNDFVDRKRQLLSTVMSLSQQVPGLRLLVSRLHEADDFILAQFHQAFDKNKTTYNRNVIEGDGSYTQKIITDDPASGINLIYDEWSNNLRESEYVKDGKVDIAQWRKEYVLLKDDVEALVNHLGKIGVNIGLNAFKGMSADEFNELFTAFSYLDGKAVYLKDEKNRPTNVFKELDNKLNKLASNEAANRGIMGESTIMGPKGQYWTFANRSFIETIVDEIKSGDLSNIKNRMQDVYTKHSLLIGYDMEMSQIQTLFDKISTQVFLSLQKGSGDAGVDTKSINDVDDLLTNINRTLANILLEGTSASNMLAPADKSTNILISGLPFILTNNNMSMKDKNGRSPVDIIRGYIYDEMAAANLETDDVLFNRGVTGEEKGLFTLRDLSSQNYLIEEQEVLDEEGNIVTKRKYKKSLSNEDIAKLNSFIEQKFNEMVFDGVSKLDSFAKFDSRGNSINSFDTLLDSRLIKYYKTNFKENYKEALMRDYIFNGMIANVEMTKLFTGYPGYYKSRVDFFKRVPATQTDGRYLYLTKGDPQTFNVAVVDSIETPSKVIWGSKKDKNGNVIEYSDLAKELYEVERKLDRPTTLQQIASILDDYSNNNIADAQGWITYDRAKFLAKKSGMWRTELNKIDKKILKGEVLTIEETKKMGPILQPWKGVHYEITPNGNPVYLKYSQAVLLPSLIKGSKLEEISKTMTDNKIDELVTVDGVKVGPGNPQNIEDVYKNGFTNIVTLKNRYWKLQQQLPSKKIKLGTLASQIQKNILANVVQQQINNNGEPLQLYNFRGRQLTGNQVVEGIIETTISLLDKQKQDIFNELGIENDDDINNLKHHPKLKNLIIKELSSRGVSENVIRAVESVESFDLVPDVREKVQSVLASYFKKRFNDIQMNVGAMIQISNYGTIDLSKKDQKGIYWIKKTEDLHGPVVKNGEFQSGQVLLPSWILDEHIPGWRDKYENPEELFGKNGIVDDRLLKAVGYRIPNQGMSSNDSLEVVGILPPEAGDSIYIYNGLTTKTGSDFDIDKMYMLFPSMVKRFKKDNVGALFDKYEITRALAIQIIEGEGISPGEYPLETLKKLIENRSEANEPSKNSTLQKMVDEFKGSEPSLEYGKKGIDGLRNKLLEYYLAVLESPATYVDKVTSIDKETKNLQNAINSIPGNNENSSFELFNPLEQVRIKNDLIKGKGGVGSTANHLVNHVYTQLYDIAVGRGANIFSLNKQYDDLNTTKVTGIISAFLNAFVDIAKDPYVLRGNFTNYTMGPTFLLLRSGVPYTTVVKFIGLSVIKKMAEENSNTKSKILSYIPVSEYSASKEDKDRAMQLIESDLDALHEGKSIEDMDDPEGAFASVFQTLKANASLLTDLIQATTYEVNGGGRSIARQLAVVNRIHNLLKNPNIFNVDFLINQDTVLGVRLMNTILNGFKAQENLFYEAAAPALLNSISTSILGGVVTSEQDIENFDKVSNSVYQALFSRMFNVQDVDGHFALSLKDKLMQMKRKYPTNTLLKSLSYDIVGGKLFYKMDNQRTKEPIEQDGIVRSWEELMVKEPNFAEFLIRKSFLESGFSPRMNAYHQYIPFTYFLQRSQSFQEQVDNLKNLNNISSISEYVAASNKELITEFKKDNTPTKLRKELNKLKVSKYANVRLSSTLKMDYTRIGDVLYKKVGTFTYPAESGDVEISVYKKSLTPFAFSMAGFNIVKSGITHTKTGNDIPNSINNESTLPLTFEENTFEVGVDIVNALRDYLKNDTLQNSTEMTQQIALDFEEKLQTSKEVKPTLDSTKSWGKLKSQPVYTEEGVNTMRTSNKESQHAHFGNPFTGSGISGLIQMSSVEDAINAYKDWLLSDLEFDTTLNKDGEAVEFAAINPEQRSWILEQINSGKLDNAILLYDQSLAGRGKGSHAQALKEVIETLRGDSSSTQSTETVREVNEDVKKLADWYNNLSKNQKELLAKNGGYSNLEIIVEQFNNVPFAYDAEDMIRDAKCFL